MITFLSADSPEAKGINAKYTLIKETEKKKYLSKEVVEWMWYENWLPVIEEYCVGLQKTIDEQSEKVYYAKDIISVMVGRGYKKFSMSWLTKLWQCDLQLDRDNCEYGYFDKYHRYVWKESFLPIVEQFCKDYKL